MSSGLDLLAKYRKAPSIQNRNQVVSHFQYLVHQNFRFDNESESYGYEGLIWAVEHFNPEKGENFERYATACIRGFGRRALSQNRSIKIPERLKRLKRKHQATERRLVSRLGRLPTQHEIQIEMGVSDEIYAELQEAMCGVLSLDAPLGVEGSDFTLGSTIADCEPEPPPPPVNQVVQAQQLKQIRSVLDTLPKETQQIVQWSLIGLTCEEIAEKLGTTHGKATKLLATTGDALRQLIQDPSSISESQATVLLLVEAAVERLSNQGKAVNVNAVATEAGIPTDVLWQHPDAFTRVRKGKDDIAQRIRTAIDTLAAKDQPFDARAVAKISGIPMTILRRYSGYLRKINKIGKERQQTA